MSSKLMLIAGGAWSGKTAIAVSLGQTHANVAWIGTSTLADIDLRIHIEKLRSNRPKHWTHVDAPFDLLAALDKTRREHPDKLLIIDSLSQWLNNEISKRSKKYDSQQILSTIHDDVEDLCTWLKRDTQNHPVIVVSGDFGQSLPPQEQILRMVRMSVGHANAKIANISGHLKWIACGQTIYEKDLQQI